MSRRKRDPTFAASEKMALINLIEKYLDIVENKKTDGFSMKKKVDQWLKIADEFNANISIHSRDWSVLKNCWENLKKRAKQEKALRKQNFLKTGKPKKFNEDPAIERVLDLINARISVTDTNFGAPNQEVEHLIFNHEINTIKIEVQPVDNEQTESNETSEWSQYTPSSQRQSSDLVLDQSPTPEMQQFTNPSPSESQHSQNTSDLRINPCPVAASNRSRRRQILRRERNMKPNIHADEHAVQINILRLQEQRQKEILKQEKLKTEQEKIKLEILKIDLKKLKD